MAESLIAVLQIFGASGFAGLFLFVVLIFFVAPMASFGLLVRSVWRAGEKLLAVQKEQTERILLEHKQERLQENEQWRQVVEGQSAAIDNLANAVRMLSGQSELVPIQTARKRATQAPNRAARL